MINKVIVLNERLKKVSINRFCKIIEISKKYAPSKTRMPDAAKVSLFMLRTYLVFLFLLLIFNLIR